MQSGGPVLPGSEDDGWLLVYVTDGERKKSALHVYDAKSMANVPLAIVPLPQFVPAGGCACVSAACTDTSHCTLASVPLKYALAGIKARGESMTGLGANCSLSMTYYKMQAVHLAGFVSRANFS